MDFDYQTELEKYTRIWEMSEYRLFSPGATLSRIFFSHFKNELKPFDRIIDFGCGTARIATQFLQKKLIVDLIDIAPNCLDEEIQNLMMFAPIQFYQNTLWQLPESLEAADWIYSADVLEHIPENKVEKSLKEMAKKTKKGGMLQIFLEKEKFKTGIDCDLHLTVKPRQWWIEKIEKYWNILSISPEKASRFRFIALVGAPHETN